jgi:hypothetical protein
MAVHPRCIGRPPGSVHQMSSRRLPHDVSATPPALGLVLGGGVSIVGGVAMIAGSALPWIRTGQTERSALTMVRIAREIGVLDTATRRVAVSSLLAIPVLVPLALVLLALGRHRSAVLVIAGAALIGGAAGAIGLRFSGTDHVGPITTLMGSVCSMVGGGALLWTRRRHRRVRNRGDGFERRASAPMDGNTPGGMS